MFSDHKYAYLIQDLSQQVYLEHKGEVGDRLILANGFVEHRSNDAH